MEKNASERQSGRGSGGSEEPVVRKKILPGNSRAGNGRTDVKGQQKTKIPASGVTGRGRREEGKNDKRWLNDMEDKMKIKTEQKDRSESKRRVIETKKEMNVSTVTFKKETEKDEVEITKKGAIGGTILQKAAKKEIGRGNEVKNELLGTGSKQSLGVKDYLTLLKLLRINLPEGVITPKVIEHSADQNVIKDAQAIIQDLESFKLKFVAIPRLGCREVKSALTLKEKAKAQEITRIIFFEKAKDDKETLKKTWQTNVSNTGRGFRMRDHYRTTPISTPPMYATGQTRSWANLGGGKNIAKNTKGGRVTVQELEKMKYSDTCSFNQAQSSPQNFGNYFQNPTDEKECLKFFHEQTGILSKYENPTYTKGNKVDFGFLTGNLDFLMEAKQKAGSAKSRNDSTSDKIIIECKGTNGDMVDKVFTKPCGKKVHKVQFIKTHQYWYQVQAYMYMLKRVKSETPVRVQAVMVVRHYHSDSKDVSKDFYWNYINKTKSKQINELRIYLEKEVLKRFLAVIALIFQKETETETKP